VRQFAQGVVLEVGHVAEIRQRVFGRALAHQRGRMLIQQAGLTDQVQAVVGQRNVFFKNGAVATPFGVALAQDERVVGQMQKVINRRLHHMCPTSSGIS
jgi:mRNA degradation ribonuclease J1/J2